MLLGRALGQAEDEHLDLVELVDAEHAARVLAGGPRLPAKARRVARVVERERVRVENLAPVHRSEPHLGGAREVEIVPLDPVDVDLLRRQEARAVHRLLADEHRWEDGREALPRHPVEREAVERELEERGGADPVDEARAGHLGPALGVDPCELEVVPRLERELRRLADAPELLGILVREAVRSARIGRGGDEVEERRTPALGLGQLLLGLLELGLDRLQLLELLGRRLALELRLRAQLVDARDEREPGAVGVHERVEFVRGALPLERCAVCLGLRSRRPDVDHARESRAPR